MQSLRNYLSAFKLGGNPFGTLTPGQGQFLRGALAGMNEQRSLSTLVPRTSTLSPTPVSTQLTGKTNSSALLQPTSTSLFTSIVRTTIRNHFPKPSEIKRIRRHGLKERLKTKAGREIIFKRILKGRHVLAHWW